MLLVPMQERTISCTGRIELVEDCSHIESGATRFVVKHFVHTRCAQPAAIQLIYDSARLYVSISRVKRQD